MSDDEGFYKLAAMVGAHERLIRDLIINQFGRLDRSLDAFDQYAGKVQNQTQIVSSPDVHAVELDYTNQLLTEALTVTLADCRQEIQKVLAQRAAQKNK